MSRGGQENSDPVDYVSRWERAVRKVALKDWRRATDPAREQVKRALVKIDLAILRLTEARDVLRRQLESKNDI